ALLSGLGVADDDQPSIRIMLQPRGHIVQNGLAGVVHAPGLLDVGEFALAQLAGFGWRRWRVLNCHLGGTGGCEATRIGASSAYSDRASWSSRRSEGCCAALTGNAAAAGCPGADCDRHVVRTGAGATHGRRGARLH